VSAPVHPTRRDLFGLAAGLVGGLTVGVASASAPPVPAPVTGGPPPPAPLPTLPDATRVMGQAGTPTSPRSVFEEAAAQTGGAGKVSGTTFAPLQSFSGTLTPTDLQFQRHHGGIAQIDPRSFQLLIHGLVDRPLTFTLDDLRRFPSVSRVHFIECAGNGRKAYRAPAPELTPQFIDGQLNNVEFTGVELKRVLAEAGVKAEADWLLVEGGDASVMTRSLPMKKALDDCILAWASNGEALRPAHGYPLRLVVPGYEANVCIKWIRRIEAKIGPSMTRDETADYTDPLPGDKARQFSFVMDAKSIILSPSHPMQLKPGFWPISGLAWSGRGKVARVDVSTDGGKTWAEAALQGANTGMAAVRFEHPWVWDGAPTLLMSRCVDETGYVQPTYAEFVAVRGKGTDYHFNPIRSWRVAADGVVTFVANPEVA